MDARSPVAMSNVLSAHGMSLWNMLVGSRCTSAPARLATLTIPLPILLISLRGLVHGATQSLRLWYLTASLLVGSVQTVTPQVMGTMTLTREIPNERPGVNKPGVLSFQPQLLQGW